MRNLWILEEATDRRSAKIGILKSMIFFMSSLSSIYEFFLSKATGSSPTILLKMNSFTDIFQRFQTTYLTLLFTKQLFWKTPFLRGSTQSAFTYSDTMELTSTMYKVNNKDIKTPSFDVFLASFLLALNRFYTLL